MIKPKNGIQSPIKQSYRYHSKSQIIQTLREEDFLNIQLPTLPLYKRSYILPSKNHLVKKYQNIKYYKSQLKSTVQTRLRLPKNRIKQLIIIDESQTNGDMVGSKKKQRVRLKQKKLKSLSLDNSNKNLDNQQLRKINKSQSSDRQDQQNCNQFIKMYLKKVNIHQNAIIQQNHQNIMLLSIKHLKTERQTDAQASIKQVKLPKYQYKKLMFKKRSHNKREVTDMQTIQNKETSPKVRGLIMKAHNINVQKSKFKPKFNEHLFNDSQMIGSKIGPWRNQEKC